jgi:hypothetical protein
MTSTTQGNGAAPSIPVVDDNPANLRLYRATLRDLGAEIRIHGAAQRMNRLIDDMLVLARMSHTEMQSEPVDLSAMAGEIVGSDAVAAGERLFRPFQRFHHGSQFPGHGAGFCFTLPPLPAAQGQA